MSRAFRAACLLGLSLAVAACDTQSRGFALPPGDAARGEVTFVELGCNACHEIKGKIDRLADGADTGINVTLGGTVTRVTSYGDLVTSIINPSHRISRRSKRSDVADDDVSKMRLYNDVMTVRQLVDLTTFLQDSYEVWVPEYRVYSYP